jgi:hypothetical protein
VFLPLMTEDQPDTAERVRWAVQAIPFALPETLSIPNNQNNRNNQNNQEAKCP